MKNIIKNLIGLFSYPFFEILNKENGITIVIFHHIDEKYFPLFEKLIFQLKNEFDFISPFDFELFLSGKNNINSKKLLLTFDDGYKSNYFIAKHILDPLNIKSIFFVNPNFAKIKNRSEQIKFMKNNFFFSNSNLDNSEISPMTFSDMKKLIKKGHYIGSHTLNHKRLSKLESKKDLNNEIVMSKVVLEEKLNTPINHFAYPFGDINSISSEAMKLAIQHYQFIYSGIRGINYSSVKRYALKRESLCVNDNILYNNFVTNNGLSFFYRKQQLRLDNIL